MLFSSVQQLIREASIYANKIAPEEDLTSVGSDIGSSDAIELNTGLRLLNELILFNNMNGNNLALLTNEQVVGTINSSSITLSGWAKLLKVLYLIGNVWRPLPFEDLNKFLNQRVINGAQGIPFTSYPQRTASGIELNFFFPLNAAYTFDIWGYKQLDIFTSLASPLIGFDEFYEVYYLYELAYRIQNYYQLPHTPFVLSQRQFLKDQLKNIKEKRRDIRISATSQVGTDGLYSTEAYSMLQGYHP